MGGGPGGQPKVDYSSELLVINESTKEGGGGSKNHKNESTSFIDSP